MTTASEEISAINAQIATLKATWQAHATNGNHADAVSLENEIAALERSVARYQLQAVAEKSAAMRQEGIDAALADLPQRDRYRQAHGELVALVESIEEAAKAFDTRMKAFEAAVLKVQLASPRWQTFRDADKDAAYRETLRAAPAAEPLESIRLALRLPALMNALREHTRLDYEGIVNRAGTL